MASGQRPAWSRGESIYDVGAIAMLPSIDAEWAWGGATGRGVRVAIVDSGIDFEHPLIDRPLDAQNGLAISLDSDGELVEERGAHDDLFGHGTACAGIVHSLAPEAEITSVRVLGSDLTGKARVFLRGLAWAIEQRFDVINLSLSTPRRDWALPFYEICDRAYFNGSFVVTAANNNPIVSFPALFSSVASVACNVATDPFEFHFNPEPPTEFLARGIDVDVAWLDGTTIQATGNSFAAPHIAGLAALILSKHPALRPFEVKSTLCATAANLPQQTPALARSAGFVHDRGNSSGRAMSAIWAGLPSGGQVTPPPAPPERG